MMYVKLDLLSYDNWLIIFTMLVLILILLFMMIFIDWMVSDMDFLNVESWIS